MTTCNNLFPRFLKRQQLQHSTGPKSLRPQGWQLLLLPQVSYAQESPSL